ncbi:hypothetical protein JVX90_00055 [Gordonia sp. PDNC005]|uniref:hypothetical protein n=1 Tax=Gordonia sp. PDNC005 TaxID=2811424 RepID=UPI0019663BB5|nr:hypothetical protein [Gordonia sp. PDNC005]QRY62705.1 hypothetical protein JVX90_00055 [Gordonia sp. PDNC005]
MKHLPWMDPATGEWDDPHACPGCELVPTRNGQECDDCATATYLDIFNTTPEGTSS